MNKLLQQICLASLLFIVSCHSADNSNNQLPKGSFGYDREFLEMHNASLVVLYFVCDEKFRSKIGIFPTIH